VTSLEQSAPETFVHNVVEAPTYVNAAFGPSVAADFTQFTLAHLPEAFAAYQLTTSSAGHGSAAPLTHLTADAVQSTTLHVDDALWFSDGFGVTTGDTLRIGASTHLHVTARDVEAKTLTVAEPVTALSGAAVQLQADTGDLGVHLP
jgi:hypothetical protein